MPAAAGAGRTRPAATTGARTAAPGFALIAATGPARLRHQQAGAFALPASGARGRRGYALKMPRPAAWSWSCSCSRCRSRCGGGVPVPFVRDAGGAVAPSLPIKLVFLSPPALPAPLTGGAAAAAARTMGPRVPAVGTAVRAPATGTRTSPVLSNTPTEGPGERCSSEHYRRSHRYRRSRGLVGRRDEPRPGAERGGVRRPLSRTSRRCPGSFNLLPSLCVHGCRPGAPGHRSPGGPPSGEGMRLVVRTRFRCLLRIQGARGHEGSPGREAMLP